MPTSWLLSPHRFGAGIVTAGLIGEWRFDDGSGQVLTDYSGNGYHGQLGSTTGADANDPDWAAVPGALKFDGTGDYVLTDSIAALDPNQNHTLQVACRLASASGTRVILGLARPDDANQRSEIRHVNNTASYQTRNSSGTFAVTGTVGVNTTDWIFLTAVLDGTTLRFFNESAGTTASTAAFSGAFSGANWRVGFGCFPRSTPADLFDGSVAWGAVYASKALTAGERAQNYAYVKAMLAPRGITLP